jgi:hypothetical protein
MATSDRPTIDDIAVWPDGTWATLGTVWNGHYAKVRRL